MLNQHEVNNQNEHFMSFLNNSNLNEMLAENQWDYENI